MVVREEESLYSGEQYYQNGRDEGMFVINSAGDGRRNTRRICFKHFNDPKFSVC